MSGGRRFRRSMSAGFVDQLKAATRETRGQMRRAFPGIEEPIKGDMPGWASELTDRFFRPEVERCSHLKARPGQPWHLVFWEGMWRCNRCAAESAVSQLASGFTLGDPEERTCDRCRTVCDSADSMVPLVIRQDLWVITLVVCEACQTDPTAAGASVWTGGAS